MSFVRIREFLPTAFSRIDARGVLRDKREADEIERIAKRFLPHTDFTYRRGIIIVFSSSAALKQKIFLSKKSIMEKIHKELPRVPLKDIIFKGPRS
ncbi:MAG: hypothetical protein HYT34_01450 [Candidatus Ryanbacteria bacterium]|nr:hypothetical protein [Candidatus Ryanbacteria bacterium]